MDIGARIREAVITLDAQRILVEQLKKDLEREEKRLGQMKTRLDSLRAQRTTRPHPIYKLPTETLSLILRESVENATQNATLMLVCHDWCRIVEADPRMWNRIRINYPDDSEIWNVEGWTETLRPFVQTWIARSGATLLDISLNLRAISHTESQIYGRILEGFKRTVVELNPAQGKLLTSIGLALDKLSCQLDTVDLYALVDDTVVSEGCSGIHITRLLEDLIGREGEVMRRWRSLIITFPDCETEIFSNIWTMFRHPTPHLHTLILKNHEDSLREWYREREERMEDQIGSLSIFPELPSLFELNASLALDWDTLSLQYNTVGSLVYAISDKADFFARINRFENLIKLEISYTSPTFGLSGRPKGSKTVSLPLLEDLTIFHYGLDVEALRFLHLNPVKLTLEPPTWVGDNMSPWLPVVNAKQVIFKRYEVFSRADVKAQKWLKHYVNHYRRAEELSFEQRQKNAVVESFHFLLSAPAPTSLDIDALKCVSFFGPQDWGSRLELWTMEELKNGRKD